MFSTFMPWLYQAILGVAMDDDSPFGPRILPPPVEMSAPRAAPGAHFPPPSPPSAAPPLPLPTATTPHGQQLGPLPTGFSTFRVAPMLPWGLGRAAGKLLTMRGRIRVSWAVDNDGVAPTTVWLNVSLPVGADTAVTVPMPPRRCAADAAVVRETGGSHVGAPGGKVSGSAGSSAQGVGALVWSHGKFVRGASSGVVGGRAVAGAAGKSAGVAFEVGSGDYAFVATCDVH